MQADSFNIFCHALLAWRTELKVTVFSDVEPEEILARIESCITAFLEQIFLHGKAPDLSLVLCHL